MAVERIAIARDQNFERIPVTSEDTLYDQLISVVLIDCVLISPQGCLRRLHDNRVTHFSRFGQGGCPAVWLIEKACHVDQTKIVASR
jgi:hypothetical protein